MTVAEGLHTALCSNVIEIEHFVPQEFTAVYNKPFAQWIPPLLIPGRFYGWRPIITDRSMWFASCNPANLALSNGDATLVAQQVTSAYNFNRLMKLYNYEFRLPPYNLPSVFTDFW